MSDDIDGVQGNPSSSTRRAPAAPNGRQRVARPNEIRVAEASAREIATPSLPEPRVSSTARAGIVVPQDIASQFVKIGESNYHYQSGKHAFTVLADRVTTASSDPQLVAQLVSVLESNRATAIAVSGSERFRQRAWRAAVSSGLTVEGYTPTKFEVAKFQRPASAVYGSTTQQAPQMSNGDGSNAQTGSLSSNNQFVMGELLEHGRAREPGAMRDQMSYFVRLRTDQGERTIWGRDLERALAVSRTQPQIGNRIGVRMMPADQMLMRSPSQISETPRGASQRTFFIVEKREFFATRAAAATILRDHDIPRDKAIERYPDLAGAYALMDIMTHAVLRGGRPSAGHLMFMAEVRDQLAGHIERGEAIPAVPLSRTAEHMRAAAKTRMHEPPVLE